MSFIRMPVVVHAGADMLPPKTVEPALIVTPVNVGLMLKTEKPAVPVSSEITPASWADVVAAN